jgi:hypothetical protein
MSKTHLARFLYSERVRRGYPSISDYLRAYNVPISESYYRDLESGRKVIRIESADALREALNLDARRFYFHLLRDVVPEAVFSKIVQPIPDTTFDAPADAIELLTERLEKSRLALTQVLMEDAYIVGGDIVAYLDANMQLLPLIHFVYLKDECTFDEVQRVARKNGVRRGISSVLGDFRRYGIALVDKSRRTVRRLNRVFRIPRTSGGNAFKDRFLLAEVQRSLQKSHSQVIGPDCSLVHSAILGLNPQGCSAVQSRLADLLAELTAQSSDLETDGALPFFVSVVVSSREEYVP